MALALRGLCPLLQVFDMRTSLRFYRDILGFEIVDRSRDHDEADWVWLRHGEAELMLNTAYDPGERPDHPDEGRRAAHGDTILYLGCPDVDAAYRYFQQRGVATEAPKTAPYGMRQLYLEDPDRFAICLQWRA